MRALFASFRFDRADGVSVESAKWQRHLSSSGWDVFRIAGEMDPRPGDVVDPSLAIDAFEHIDTPQRKAEVAVEDAIDHIAPDLVIVENVFGLPFNIHFARALSGALEGRPSILRHHDLYWQRDRFCSSAAPPPALFPPHLETARHVVINDLSRDQLRDLGIDSVVIRNGFDLSTRRARERRALDLKGDSILLTQPTRAIPRKRIDLSVALAVEVARLVRPEGRRVTLLVTGPAEEGYGPELERLSEVLAAEANAVLVHSDGRIAPDDFYPASDFILFPSSWEGFGNPVIESVAWRKPLVVTDYPVLREFREMGFDLIDWGADAAKLIANGHRTDATHNLRIAREFFALEERLKDLDLLIDEILASGSPTARSQEVST